MTLKEARIRFTVNLPSQIDYAISCGFQPMIGFAFTCQDCTNVNSTSLSKLGLSCDLVLLQDMEGNYITEEEMLRIKFTSMLSNLIRKAVELEYQPALGFAKRCSDCKVGMIKSLHKKGLAVDLLLYNQDGKYLMDEESYLELGLYWQAAGGNRPITGDFNHFSLEHGGLR